VPALSLHQKKNQTKFAISCKRQRQLLIFYAKPPGEVELR